MTEPNRNLSEVPALIAERKKYESWLEALDARRETTAVHVFERVQADYRTRLRRVAEQIASYRQAIEEERTNVDSRLSLLEAEERMRRDERAELELRAHVGELSGDEAVSSFSTVDEAVEKLVAEKEGLQSRINELDALLDVPDLPAEPVPAARVSEPVAAQSAPVSAEEPTPPPGRDSKPVEAMPEPRISQQVKAPEEPAARRPSVETQVEPEPVTEPATVASPAGSDIPRISELRTPSGTFDELKFLNTVIGRGTGTAAPAKETAPAKANDTSSARPAGERTSASIPLYPSVPSGTPNRPSAAMEQTKTLKCSECGAQNYPTEWYCERCGAELAAL